MVFGKRRPGTGHGLASFGDSHRDTAGHKMHLRPKPMKKKGGHRRDTGSVQLLGQESGVRGKGERTTR